MLRFVSVLLLMSLCWGFAEDKRPMTFEDLWASKRVGSPVISPDGKWLAFTLKNFDVEKNKGETDLWLAPVDGSAPPRQITFHKGSDSSPFWSPDGKTLGFSSKRGDQKASQLHLLPMNGGEARPITDLPVSPSNVKWLPDGKRIMFTAKTFPDLDADFEAVAKRLKEQKKDKTKAKISETKVVRYWDHYLTDGSVQHLFVMDVDSAEITDLTADLDWLQTFWGMDYDLSPDGKTVAFSANTTKPPYQTLNFDVFLMDVASRESRNITPSNPASDSNPQFSPDGKTLIYEANDRVAVAPDYQSVVKYDLEKGEVEKFRVKWDGDAGNLEFSHDGKWLYFTGSDNGYSKLFRASMKNGKVKTLVANQTIKTLAVGPEGLVFGGEVATRPAEFFTLGYDKKAEPKQLTHFNKELYSQIDMGNIESHYFKGAGGDKVQMFLIYPPGFDKSKKWPLVHMIHGGPHGAFMDSFHYRWNMALVASKGYVVAAVNFHGSTGFGQKFTESILGNHADKPFEDIMKATDHILEMGFVDEQRMGAMGGSYGGYMVSWILGHTDRFQCLINHAGVYDLMSQFASDWTWGRPNNYGASPWQDPARIDKYSPSRFAADFKTPTLIIHGEKDYRVPYQQGLNLHQVLTGKGVTSRLVIYPKENHWVLKPQGAQLWWTEVHDWLGRYLQAE